MDLNTLLKSKGIDPREVIVMRHRPPEARLAKVIGWLAAEKPDLFNAYQQTQGAKVERAMLELVGKGYVASFIAYGSGKALFVGLYKIGETTPLTFDTYWNVPAYAELREFNMNGFVPEPDRQTILWFDLTLTNHFVEWKGKLVIGWPAPDISWWRRAERNVMPVIAINEESVLETAMPAWDAINLSWEELSVLPSKWRSALSHWRGVYFIFDESDGKGYVGSAYGDSNIYGRWSEYSASGHGGNKLLKKRNPCDFRFSILQRVSPDMSADEVIRLESSWKARLHTRHPFGLNEN
jgi:hypothetical protein